MNAVENKKGLGRGLASLLRDEGQDYAALDKLRQSKTVGVEQIQPCKTQPRKHFDEKELEALAESIKSKGILQPLLVRRKAGAGNTYELVAGERRWRAAQMAGLHEVPVVIKDLNDLEVLEISLIENIQRQDLNAIEEAQSYDRLMKDFKYTQDEVATALGKSRSYIANILRHLMLPPDVQKMVFDGKISAAHARTLLTSTNPSDLAAEIMSKDLNVRQSEELARAQKMAPAKNDSKSGAKIINLQSKAKFSPQNQNAEKGPDANTRDLENQLAAILGMRVEIQFAGKAGQLTVHYQNLEQLDDVLRRLGQKK
jgi:ParB family chromosome partitioning protein